MNTSIDEVESPAVEITASNETEEYEEDDEFEDDEDFDDDLDDSEDDLYDLMDEVDPEDVLYLELNEGAADVLIRMDAFLPNPIAVRGDEDEILKLEKALCRKVR